MLADPPRLVAHLDMDAFYASVELLRYPELRGQPVVIGGGARHQPTWITDSVDGTRRREFAHLRGYVGRGVVTTATYEARAFGVNSAMAMMRAAQLAPDAILLPVDFDEYRRYSRLFKAAAAAIAPHVEDRGIDEIYIELTDVVAARVEHAADVLWCARELGQEIKNAVRSATGLSCSIGIAPNKLLAKMASELDKPDGLTLLTAEDLAARIWPLPARRINGIGPKASAKLAALGIRTIGELAQAGREWLIERFGASYGAWLHDAAHGHDDRPVVTFSEPKSISRETTFERDLHPVRDRAALTELFTELCSHVAADLARKRYVGKTIGVKLRFDNFRTVTRDKTLEAPTADAALIRKTAGECVKRIELDRKIRLLGVRVGALVPAEPAATPPADAAGEPTLEL
ncbi:MAG TPA: DNA polymerase IV [Burkholderiaceae bacterium]|nr:DNA polymerase IV [Burkholderiaceae bacterium]